MLKKKLHMLETICDRGDQTVDRHLPVDHGCSLACISIYFLPKYDQQHFLDQLATAKKPSLR